MKKLLIVAILSMMATSSVQAKGIFGSLIGELIGKTVGHAMGTSWGTGDADYFKNSVMPEADELNKSMPQVINKYFRLDTVVAIPQALTVVYYYTMTTVGSDEFTGSGVIRYLESSKKLGVNKSCSDPQVRNHLINHGVIMEYDYYYNDGIFMGSYSFKQSDCA
jgi:hypothetical protein